MKRTLAHTLLLLPALLVMLACSTEAPAPRRGIILVLIDTLQADHLGCSG